MSTCSYCGAKLSEGSVFCSGCGTPVDGVEADELLASAASDPTGFLDRLRAATEGEFTIIRELGRGGMGRVYLAHEIALDRRVALKALPPALTEHAEIVLRFQREARTAGQLSHPHIVHVYQVLERGGIIFFTMPYVAGPSLRQILRRTPRLDVGLCRRYLRESADALAFAHSRGVIHRDIKPENMLLEGSHAGRLLLTDFGIAKPLGAVATLTRPGDMMGTPYYMSPEQCEEREDVDGRSDQYSLGLVAYEMLAGRFPFTADSLAGIVYKHVHEYPESLEKVRPEVPKSLRFVIVRAIRKEPGDRYPTMDALLEDLRAGKRGARLRRLARMPRRRVTGRPRIWGIGAVVAAAAVIALASVVWQQLGSSSGPDTSRPAGSEASEGEGEQVGGGEPAAFDIAPAAADSGTTGGRPEVGAPVEGAEATAQDEAARPTEPVAGPAGENAPLGDARRQALAARAAAESARRTAVEMAADTLFPERFRELESRLTLAGGALEEGQIVSAAIDFEAARIGFEDLAALARQRLAEAVEEGGPPAKSEAPAVLDSLVAESPEAAIASLLETYRLALEGEDLDRLSDQVYRGAIPEQDARFLGLLFESADQLAVTIEVEELSLRGAEAEAAVKQGMKYQLSVTHEDRTHELALRMFFERQGLDWRLARFEQR
jgi:hypothetical protein